MEPQWKQHKWLYAAGTSTLYTRRRAGCTEQQRRDITGLERKSKQQCSKYCKKIVPTVLHSQILSDSNYASSVAAHKVYLTLNCIVIACVVLWGLLFNNCSLWNKYHQSYADVFYLKFALCSLTLNYTVKLNQNNLFAGRVKVHF